MNYILDTHILVWYLSGSTNLSQETKGIILNTDNTIYYSVLSLWEILLKSKKEKIVKYKSINDLNVDIIDMGLIPLPLYPRHIYAIEEISLSNQKLEHKDPFDRALMAQAKENKMFLLTHDIALKQYKEKYIKFV